MDRSQLVLGATPDVPSAAVTSKKLPLLSLLPLLSISNFT